jgi:hypothetical protein
MADIDDFDLDRSTVQAWAEFQTRLAEVISMIDESGDLTIGTNSEASDQAPYVRFRSSEAGRLQADAADNAELGQPYQLGAGQLEAMETMGWHRGPADGGPHLGFWVEAAQEDSEWMAELAVRVLRDVYGVQHPVFLAPDQLAEVLRPVGPTEPVIDAPAHLERVLPVDFASTLPRNRSHLTELVDAELTAMYGHPPIRDEEGDVAIRVGSTMVFLRTANDGQEVVVFAALVHDVEGRSRATEVLNDLNVEARWVKFQLVRDRVFVTLSVPARPFVPAHLQQAVRIMSEVADGIDDELASKLRGRTTFSDYGDGS